MPFTANKGLTPDFRQSGAEGSREVRDPESVMGHTRRGRFEAAQAFVYGMVTLRAREVPAREQ